MGLDKCGLKRCMPKCGHLPNLVNPPRESVHNSPRLVNEHNMKLPHIIKACIVSESALKVYI